MKVGLDFDNTIVCYDRLFHALAVERGLIPPQTPTNKTAVRDYLRSIGREDDWTELQGTAYGPEIIRAEPFPGVLDFLHTCRSRGLPVAIISHKTKHPYRGPAHDLHAAARLFLNRHGLLDAAKTGLSDENVFLELTKEAKLARIAAAGCTHFIDDLPEFLGEAAFPTGVNRILFDPDGRYAEDSRWRRVRAWSDLATLDLPVAEPSAVAVGDLLATAGLPNAGWQLDPITGGGNNRGYRLMTADGRRFFLKWYFRHPDDPRYRLGTEFVFTTFCRGHGIDDVPLPLARDAAAGLALYEFIDGRRLTPGEVDASAVATASDFFRRLNEHRAESDAAALPIASEACFSADQHLERIERRVQALADAANNTADAEFCTFVERDLYPAWRKVRSNIGGGAVLLDTADRCLSPSDFGFHNALRQGDGRLRFIDLEYAGWDDPAKTICDFFCQVQLPVPIEQWTQTAAALTAAVGRHAEFERRAVQLLPAYRIKWCCIVLNVFLPTGSARRSFGTAQAATAERRAFQLQQARAVLARLPQDFQLAK